MTEQDQSDSLVGPHVEAEEALEAGFVVCGSMSTRTKKYHLPDDGKVEPKCRHGTRFGAGKDAEGWFKVDVNRSRLRDMSLCRHCDPDANSETHMPEKTGAERLEELPPDFDITGDGEQV